MWKRWAVVCQSPELKHCIFTTTFTKRGAFKEKKEYDAIIGRRRYSDMTITVWDLRLDKEVKG